MWQQKSDAFDHSLPSIVENQSGNEKPQKGGHQKIQDAVHHIGRKEKKTQKKNKKLTKTHQTDIRKEGAGVKPFHGTYVFGKSEKVCRPKQLHPDGQINEEGTEQKPRYIKNTEKTFSFNRIVHIFQTLPPFCENTLSRGSIAPPPRHTDTCLSAIHCIHERRIYTCFFLSVRDRFLRRSSCPSAQSLPAPFFPVPFSRRKKKRPPPTDSPSVKGDPFLCILTMYASSCFLRHYFA